MPGEPTAERPSTRVAAKPRRAAPALLKVDPKDLRPRILSSWERWRGEFRTGLPSLGVSLGAHLVVLMFLALIVVRHLRSYDPPGLEGGWVAPVESRTKDREVAPVKVEAVKLDSTTKSAAPKEQKPVEASEGDKPASVPVKAVGVEQMLSLRSERLRSNILEKVGANNSVERAINGGLSWLARQQQANGNWKLHEGYPDAGYKTLRTDTGATALALLPFLGTGNTHLGGPHQAVVAKGIEWLKSVQKPNGDFHDHDELGRRTAFYAHSQAVIVLCEALALTKDDSLRESAERGVAYLLESQQTTLGGWKYMPQNEDTVADLSVTGCALMALHTARAAGISVSEDAYIRANGFLDTVSSQGGARYRFEPTHSAERVNLAMTAEGLVSRQFLGWPKDHPAMIDGLAWIASGENRPEWTEGRRNVYAWYFAGHALHNVGGSDFKTWYMRTSAEIVKSQLALGSNKRGQDVRGSWSPKNPSGDENEFAESVGRLYVTSLSLLVLELPFRHLPVYKSESGE